MSLAYTSLVASHERRKGLRTKTALAMQRSGCLNPLGEVRGAPFDSRTERLLDAELADERQAHKAHLAERAAKEADQGRKFSGRKPNAPEDKAGHRKP